MGIIRAAASAVGGALADQWLEVIEPDSMNASTLMTTGVAVRRDDRRSQNKKGTRDVITDGSVIHVGEGQCMLLVDGGKVIDFSAEPGYYTVNNPAAPSLFNGQFDEAVLETFQRVKFGGVTPVSQSAVFISTQEVKNIPFGTVNPINYFDNFYNAELYLRAHGYFSIRIVDPLKFYTEAVPRGTRRMETGELQQLYLSEFLTALQAAIGLMSVDGIRISHVTSKSLELAKYLSSALDEDWTLRRGMQVESVGISSISYDDASKKLINMRNEGAMLSDPGVREGYVQGSVARGVEAAGSNSGGAMSGFMGVNMGMQHGAGFSAANQAQMERERAERQAAPEPGGWDCRCGAKGNRGGFCPDCGEKRPQAAFCPSCGERVPDNARFCAACGHRL